MVGKGFPALDLEESSENMLENIGGIKLGIENFVEKNYDASNLCIHNLFPQKQNA